VIPRRQVNWKEWKDWSKESKESRESGESKGSEYKHARKVQGGEC
jgi:hypothetical protein